MRIFVAILFFVVGGHSFPPLYGQAPPCPSLDSLATVGDVVGQVLDAQNQVPLGFVQVRLRIQGVEAPFEGVSNTSGHFQFCSVPAGTFTISGQLGQLGNLVGPGVLEAGQTLSVALNLAPSFDGQNTGTLTGVVVDVDSGEPIEGATVLLPDLGQTAITNPLGRFTFPSLTPGNVNLEVTRLGYAEATGEVNILFARTVNISVALSQEAILLEPITVSAVRRRIELPGLEDFERRLHSGWGQFVLEDEIQRRAPSKLTDVLYETGVEVRGNGQAIYMRRTGCGPMVYIDGIKVTHLPRSKSLMGAGGRSTTATYQRRPSAASTNLALGEGPAGEAADAVNNLVHPADVVAMEIYRGPAETPGQYLDSNAQCGVILIWTRRGNIGGLR